MYDRDIRSFLPSYYDEIKEIEAIMNSEDAILSDMMSQISLAFHRTFVVTADEAGIEVFEQELKIVANPAYETLEFRRSRIISRLSMKLPFSIIFLRNLLNEYLGVGNYQLDMNYGTYTLTLDTSVTQFGALDELMFLLVTIIPVNILYLVNNRLVCYNETNVYRPGAIGFGMMYEISQDMTLVYNLSRQEADAGATSQSHIYDLSREIRAVYSSEITTGNPGVISGAIQYILN